MLEEVMSHTRQVEKKNLIIDSKLEPRLEKAHLKNPTYFTNFSQANSTTHTF